MDFILPEESKLCKDFMQRFLLRLDERRSAEHRQPTTKAATARQVARARSVPVKDGQRASRATEQGMRARSTAREESPEVVAAVARARRRASEEKRRQAKAEEATAKALQKERYGKRDERLARFSEDTKVKQRVLAPRPSPVRSFGAGLGLDSEHLDLLLTEELDLM